ncbi:MAG TPA: acetyl-CoA C-acetyltransferase [Eubacteriales bacterium]|nr:acetyl-CoA C-acetyltransferase [Eubacteriales bacterium]
MKIYLVAAKRTAVGSFLGSLVNVKPGDLGATVVKNILEETKLDPKNVDEVIVGNILGAGQAQNVGRQVAIKGGIPQEVPAYTVNMVCGSGMKAVINAVMDIRGGFANVVIAGGTESMSGAPYLIPSKTRTGNKMGVMEIQDHMILDSLTDAFSNVHMGITAENIAEKYGITREQQDAFAYDSQVKAIKSVDDGLFKKEIVPVNVKIGKEEKVFDTDEYPNRGSNPEKLAKLRAAFKDGGTVTAGNASGINDGASFVMVASEEAVKKYNLKPLVEIIAVGQGGVDPQYMGLGPVPAIRMALSNAQMKLSQMEVIELNEAFAAQSLGVVKLLSDEHDLTADQIRARTNPRGGAIAIGHPVGASGNRILVTLIHEMIDMNKNIGLASLCIGGGMGTAIIVKKA